MKRRHPGIALLILALLCQVAWGNSGPSAGAGQAGTRSFGGELLINFLPAFNNRAGTTYLPLTLDWHPFHGEFHVSGGLILSQSKMDPDPASEQGVIPGAAHFERPVPYLGVGWNNAFGEQGRWGIRANLGVAFLGQPHAYLMAAGVAPAFRADLTQHQRDIEDDLSILKVRPVVSISLFFRF